MSGINKNGKLVEDICDKILFPEVNVNICNKVYKRFTVILYVHIELR